MSRTRTTIEAWQYFDEEGCPTCANNFKSADVCQFYRTQRFGTMDTCLFATEGSRGMSQSMKRRKNGEGTLIPGEWCPLFKHWVIDREK